MKKTHAEYFGDTLLELKALLREGPKCDDVIVQSREIVSKYNQLGFDDSNLHYLVFLCIDSDTDHLPKGSVRELWNKEALKSKDLESKVYEESSRSDFVKACKSLHTFVSG